MNKYDIQAKEELDKIILHYKKGFVGSLNELAKTKNIEGLSASAKIRCFALYKSSELPLEFLIAYRSRLITDQFNDNNTMRYIHIVNSEIQTKISEKRFKSQNRGTIFAIVFSIAVGVTSTYFAYKDSNEDSKWQKQQERLSKEQTKKIVVSLKSIEKILIENSNIKK